MLLMQLEINVSMGHGSRGPGREPRVCPTRPFLHPRAIQDARFSIFLPFREHYSTDEWAIRRSRLTLLSRSDVQFLRSTFIFVDSADSELCVPANRRRQFPLRSASRALIFSSCVWNADLRSQT